MVWHKQTVHQSGCGYSMVISLNSISDFCFLVSGKTMEAVYFVSVETMEPF